jgi:trans-2-enoyl-CoA reductase
LKRSDVQEAELWQAATEQRTLAVRRYSDFHNLFGFGFDGVDYERQTKWLVLIVLHNTKYKYLFS